MNERGKKRQLIGVVASSSMDKTIVVRVERIVKHQTYKKYIRRSVKFAAHDKDNTCRVGDKVLITESRPLSRCKRWRLSKIIEKAV